MRTGDAGPRDRGRPSLGLAGRMLLAETLVVLAMALTSWTVASAVGPGLFRDHLARVGVQHDPAEQRHVDEAFATALVLSLVVALMTAVLLALLVTWYLCRRVQRSIRSVVGSARRLADGDYRARLRSPRLGTELDQLGEAVNALARRLDQVETTRRRMLSDLAHEMRTPLSTIEAHLEALEDGVRQPDEATLSVLRDSTGRLRRLAEDVRAVSQVQEGGVEIRCRPVPAERLVREAVRAWASRYQEAGVALHADVDAAVRVTADPERMAQVIGNLLDNALRHTPTGGTVTVSARAEDGSGEIRVQDTGDGIAAADLDAVFSRFYRVGRARDRGAGGSGIGLTIARALVEAQQGTLYAASAGLGHGATFTIRLPLA